MIDIESGPELLSCAVLAGGSSRRLGVDKALLRLTPDSPTILERTIDIAHSLSDDVMVIGREASEKPQSDVRFIADRHPGQGPLAGIATALSAARHDRCLVLPCDAPFLSLDVLKWMRSQPQPGDVLVPQTKATTRQSGIQAYQTLHAIYRRACVALIEAHLARGERATTSWFADAIIQVIPELDILPIDPELLTFFSINTPDDLDRARRIATARRFNAGSGSQSVQPL